jgi:non-specific serine/threonine protein kinase
LRLIVSLAGAPGVGKSRLGLQVAIDALDAFSDGAWLVELAPLTDPQLVPHAVAATLGIREEPGRLLPATVADRLGARRLLLLLDNCEHLIVAVATLAHMLLRACPALRIMTTSREPLLVEGEAIWRVPSLTLPDVERLRRDGFDAGAVVVESEAARLFVERARSANPAFRLTEQSVPAVSQICERLDGIPLALELAAARVRAVPLETIAARLDQRFGLLTGGSRTALPRHQTLRAAVEWSHELLPEPEQVLLRRLAVFSGAWTLEGAEAVCADDLLPSHRLLGLLVSLVDKSLVQLDGAGMAARYRLLGMMREFGIERLAHHRELATMRDRHLEYFSVFAQEIAPQLPGPSEGALHAQIEREHDNLRAALAWSIETAHAAGSTSTACPPSDVRDRAEIGLRLAGNLMRFWWRRGHLGEGQRWLEQALAAIPQTSPLSDAAARALYGAARLAAYQGDYRTALRQMEQARALWEQLGRETDLASACLYLGNYSAHGGDYESAARWCEEGLRLARSVADARRLQEGLLTSAIVAWRMGRFERSAALIEESIPLFEASAEQTGLPYALRVHGRALWGLGDQVRAERLVDRSLLLSRAAGDKRGIAESFKDYGYIAARTGDADRAGQMFRTSLQLYREIGDRWGIVLCLHGLAGAWTLRGIQMLQTDAGVRAGDSRAAAHFAGAAQLFAASAAIREADSTTLPRALEPDLLSNLASLKHHLDDARLARARAEGPSDVDA